MDLALRDRDSHTTLVVGVDHKDIEVITVVTLLIDDDNVIWTLIGKLIIGSLIVAIIKNVLTFVLNGVSEGDLFLSEVSIHML